MNNFQILTVICLLVLLLIIAWCDQRTMTIPNGLVLACMIPAVLAVFAFPEVTISSRLIGIVSVSLPLLLITILVPGAFGGGDIKLMAVLGFFLGWKNCLIAFAIAVLAGGLYGLVFLVLKKKSWKAHFAFGPFLCAGTIVTMFAGEQLLSWFRFVLF